MWKKTSSHVYNSLLIPVLVPGVFILFLTFKINAKAEAVLYSMRPVIMKQYTIPPQSNIATKYLNSDFLLKNKNPVYARPVSISENNILKIKASDALDGIKYSQPDIAYSLFNLNLGLKVPTSTFSKNKHSQASSEIPSSTNFPKESFPILHISEKDALNPIKDVHYLNSVVSEEASSDITGIESTDNSGNRNLKNVFEPHNHDDKNTNLYVHKKNNFTDANENLMPLSSDSVLSYEIPVADFNHSNIRISSLNLDSDVVSDMPNQVYSGYNTFAVTPESKIMLPELTTPNSVHLNTLVYTDYVNSTNLTTDIMSTSIFPLINNDENITNMLSSTDNEKKLSSWTVAGIVIGILICVTLLSSAVIYLLYRKFNGKCTGMVECKFNSDNCGYLDDSLRSSIYLNNHIELPKESSEEMTSLDNDSFLNSLETMTIQNYWADSSKNTKV